jgi:AcrR family transcriptional regulator
MSKRADFRTETGKARRARTRRRIAEAAFGLFDARGVGTVTVDDVRHAASLSRGSFYNYFATFEAMLFELGGDITTQINREQDQFGDEPDVGIRVFQFMRYFMLRAVSDRACSEILLRVMPLVGAPTPQMRQHATRTRREAMKQGASSRELPELSMEIGYGVCAVVLRRALVRGPDKAEISEAAGIVLKMQGMPPDMLEALKAVPLPKMPKRSLREAVLNPPAGIIGTA